jgi:hypothetical protein
LVSSGLFIVTLLFSPSQGILTAPNAARPLKNLIKRFGRQ